MKRIIKRVAVLGAGVMGATIAAHFANVGIPVYLLDIVPRDLNDEEKKKGLTLDSPEVRNRFSLKGKEVVSKAKPAALYSAEDISLITVGNFEDNLNWLTDVDWIIEVVIENLPIKKALMEKVAQFRRPGTIVSSNTSGISIAKIVADMPLEFRQHFLGTHFFNPPRYMKLLEIIPTPDTLSEVTTFISGFGEKVLGKGIVMAKDTPNFIANRIGVFGLLATIRAMEKGGYTVEETDTITGTALGRPKSASFRTLDMVGLDTFIHVANNVYESASPEEQKDFVVAPFLQEMVNRGWLGDKTGQGFYKKIKTAEGKEILALDYNTMEYQPKSKVKLPSLEAAKNIKELAERVKSLVYAKDRAGAMAWQVTRDILIYAAAKIPEIADNIISIDQAMKWGFNWELGPFETWDTIGVEKSVAKMKEEGVAIPAWVEAMLAAGYKTFYRSVNGQDEYYDISSQTYKLVNRTKEMIILRAVKDQQKVIHRNSGASLIDLGDGVACLEFHSPNNAIGADIIQMMNYSVQEVARNYRGLVIGNQAKNFCVGANLMMVLMEAQDENWDDIDYMVKSFQDACMALKYSAKPVVAAPFGMTLGGGCEVVLHTARIQSAAETYMGLVELGVGLIPGGGGNKEVLIRNIEGISPDVKVDLQLFVNRAFETIAMAKVSTSGKDAQRLGYMRPSDGVTVNADHLIYEAKRAVLALDDQGYKPPVPKPIRVVGAPGYAVMQLGAYTLRQGGFISEYDEHLAKKVAFVLAGGGVPANTLVSEQYLLDIEREAFLSLCGERKTQDRMAHMLTKGKPLRN